MPHVPADGVLENLAKAVHRRLMSLSSDSTTRFALVPCLLMPASSRSHSSIRYYDVNDIIAVINAVYTIAYIKGSVAALETVSCKDIFSYDPRYILELPPSPSPPPSHPLTRADCKCSISVWDYAKLSEIRDDIHQAHIFQEVIKSSRLVRATAPIIPKHTVTYVDWKLSILKHRTEVPYPTLSNLLNLSTNFVTVPSASVVPKHIMDEDEFVNGGVDSAANAMMFLSDSQ